MRRKEVKPKLEKVIEVTGETPGTPLSGKRKKILEWMEKQEKVPIPNLRKPSNPLPCPFNPSRPRPHPHFRERGVP